ncbi:MAG: hypothetical protein JWO86_8282 [Myxococcaceae bacterium]|nr:hypothetical protein [Myxococcaceae bacterium]
MSRSSAAAFDDAPSTDSSTDEGNASAAQPTWAEDKNPTRRLPFFRLEEEARRLDLEAAKASASERDEDATVTVSAEENKKLLASVFAAAAGATDSPDPGSSTSPDPGSWNEHPSSDDEPTLDAPAPSSPEAIAALSMPRAVRVTARPPALKMLVITRPPPPAHVPRSSVAPAAVISAAAVMPSIATEPVAFPRTSPALVMSLWAPPPAGAPAAFVAPPPSGFRRKITPELARSARELREAEDRRRSVGTFTIRLPKRNAQNYVVAGIWAMALSLFAVLLFMATSA